MKLLNVNATAQFLTPGYAGNEGLGYQAASFKQFMRMSLRFEDNEFAFEEIALRNAMSFPSKFRVF